MSCELGPLFAIPVWAVIFGVWNSRHGRDLSIWTSTPDEIHRYMDARGLRWLVCVMGALASVIAIQMVRG